MDEDHREDPKRRKAGEEASEDYSALGELSSVLRSACDQAGPREDEDAALEALVQDLLRMKRSLAGTAAGDAAMGSLASLRDSLKASQGGSH